MFLVVLEKNGNRSPQQPESVAKTPLVSSQRSLQVEQNCPLERVAGPLAQVQVGRSERLFRALQIRSDAARIADIGPRPRSQVFDQLISISSGVQVL